MRPPKVNKKELMIKGNETYLEVLRDLWADLGLELNPAQVVRRHFEDVIKLADMFVDRYFNAHLFIIKSVQDI